MEPLRIFDSFNLDDLDEAWVNSVWSSDFLTYEKVPDEYLLHSESEDMEVLLKESYMVLKNWISEGINENDSDNQRSEVSWQTLITLNVNVRSLLAILGNIIHNGQRSGEDEDSRQSCLKATSLYLILLAVPGSMAFQVFHPNLYHKALNTFKLSEHIVTKSLKKKSSDMYYDEDAAETLMSLERVTLTKGLNSVMFDLIMMLKKFCMRDQIRSMEVTVHSLLEVAKLETETVLFELSTQKREASVASLSYNSYIALQELCDARHGPVDVTVRLIAKYMLPHFLSNNDDLAPKALSIMRETMILFLKNLLESNRKQAKLGISILIQHLLVKCPDRVEARQKQAVLIMKLIDSCGGSMYMQAVDNLILLAHHNKIPCRIFAQEIIGKFLIESTANNENLTEARSLLKLKIKKLLMATVLSRCVDSSSMVRGKAMATIAECTDPQNNVALTTIQEIFEGSSKDKPLPNVELLRQAMTENIDPLPGSNTIIFVLMDRAEDERALVRRSALQTLGNLVPLFPGLLETVAPALGTHCRDPALTVRRFAIQVLTQLLEQYPDHPALLEEWVRAVLPQVFDIEIKVQEKVLECLEQLVLNNIAHFSTSNNNNRLAALPWSILNQVTERKMRKHLSKACSIWQQTGVIQNSLISKVQSHLCTDNNIAAWVLLAAFSEKRVLRNMTSHFENYKELITGETLHASLALEVLRNSWVSLDTKFLQMLHQDLFECLAKFQVYFGSISICLDILVGVIKQLHPENGSQLVQLSALDLMKLSEAQLGKIFLGEEEAANAAPVYLKAMCTLGNAAHLCTGAVTSSTLRILQGLLLQWNTLPTALRNMEQLRAAAVALLGQQAMRDREIAQETMPILGCLMRKSITSNSRMEAAVRVNAAKALADLCVRFTALVEPYLPDMCVSMRDSNPIVREVIVVLFIQLLLEDFIKVKGPFFFHILTMLTDSDETIRELTVFLIKERLLVKNKTLISQQFLESIFHYNNLKSHNKFRCVRMSERERAALTLPGQKNQERRRTIYNFMLDHLDPPGKLKLLVRLSSEVLGGVLNKSIDIDAKEGSAVLMDTVYILSRDQLQPSSCTKHTEDDGQEENMPPPVTPANNAANVIVEGMKKHGLEVLTPILVKLKRMLAKTKSVLLGEVTRFFLKVISEYNKDQLANMFTEYPGLEKEIEQDQRKFAKKPHSDDDRDYDTEEEAAPSPTKRSPTKHAVVNQNRMPKIVLRRLSSLTYPGICNWKSPSRSSNFGGHSPQPGPSGNRRRSASSSPASRLHSPPSSQPGPSSTTQRTCRSSLSFSSPRYSPRYSPIYATSFHSPMKLRERRSTIVSDDEELMPGYLGPGALFSPRVVLHDFRASTPFDQKHSTSTMVEEMSQLQTESDSD